MRKEVSYSEAVSFNPRRFCLNVYHNNDYRQQKKHETQGSKIFFDDIKVYNLHKKFTVFVLKPERLNPSTDKNLLLKYVLLPLLPNLSKMQDYE